jgi:hypothetical protein
MKQLYLIFILLMMFPLLYSQDIITKRNGDQIKVKVIEINSETIKYKDFDFQDGPLRNIKISEVLLINYQNGSKDVFAKQEENSREVKDQPVEAKKVYKGNYFMIGTGYGISYGGLGVRLQGRFGGAVGVGIHGGVGYFPGESILVGGGVKFFPYKGLYIDTQFGMTGYETYTETWSGSYSYSSNEKNALYGPSLMVGIDQVWGRRVGIGFNAALGVSYNINSDYGNDFFPEIDLGFLIRF